MMLAIRWAVLKECSNHHPPVGPHPANKCVHINEEDLLPQFGVYTNDAMVKETWYKYDQKSKMRVPV